MIDQTKFWFCIARKWKQDIPLKGDNICIYTIHNKQFHYDDKLQAKIMLDYVNLNSDKSLKYEIVRFIQIGN